MPLSSTFGRRPVLLASTLLSLVSSIWKAEARTYNSFMGACVLNGIGAGTGEVRRRLSSVHAAQPLTVYLDPSAPDHSRLYFFA